MDNSIRLALPYIMPSQAQKHVTHNEALRMLDALVQPCIETTPTDIPPEEPQEGMVYAINGSPSGKWANHANSLAAYQDGTWFYFSPIKGWQFLVKDDMEKITFDGAKWISTSSGEFGKIESLGINTSSDDNNRLTVESPNSLFSHEGESHQMKINKASEGNTASLVFQSDFSSRAEIGLVGDDDLVFKTSSNGHDYTDVLRANSVSGKIQINNLGINKMPDTNLHVYAPTSTATLRVQSDATGTSGSPFADLSHDGSSFYVSNWGGGEILHLQQFEQEQVLLLEQVDKQKFELMTLNLGLNKIMFFLSARLVKDGQKYGLLMALYRLQTSEIKKSTTVYMVQVNL